MKKIILLLVTITMSMTVFCQIEDEGKIEEKPAIKLVDIKPKADIACKDLIYNGVDYSNACYVKLVSLCIVPRGTGETVATYILFNSERAMASGQSNNNVIVFSYPSIGFDNTANEDIIRIKLADILGVKIEDINLK